MPISCADSIAERDKITSRHSERDPVPTRHSERDPSHPRHSERDPQGAEEPAGALHEEPARFLSREQQNTFCKRTALLRNDVKGDDNGKSGSFSRSGSFRITVCAQAPSG